MGNKKKEVNVESGKRLKKLIATYSIPQKVFAEMIGYTEQHLSLIVTGKRSLTIEAAKRIAQMMNVRVEWLMGLDDYMTQHDVDVSPQLDGMNRRKDICGAMELLARVVGYEISKLSNDGEKAFQILANSDGCYIEEVGAEYCISKKGNKSVKLKYDEFLQLSKEIADFTEFKLNKVLKEVENDG